MASCLAWHGHLMYMKRFVLFQKKNNRTTLILRPSIHQSVRVVRARVILTSEEDRALTTTTSFICMTINTYSVAKAFIN